MLRVDKIALNWGFVTFPFLNLSKSLKNSLILILFIKTKDLSLDSTSFGSLAMFIVGYENLFSRTFNPFVLEAKNLLPVDASLEAKFLTASLYGFSSKLNPGNISWGWSTS